MTRYRPCGVDNSRRRYPLAVGDDLHVGSNFSRKVVQIIMTGVSHDPCSIVAGWRQSGRIHHFFGECVEQTHIAPSCVFKPRCFNLDTYLVRSSEEL